MSLRRLPRNVPGLGDDDIAGRLQEVGGLEVTIHLDVGLIRTIDVSSLHDSEHPL